MSKVIIKLPNSLKARFNKEVKFYASNDPQRLLYLYNRLNLPDGEQNSLFNIFQQDPDTDFYYSSQLDCIGGGVDFEGRGFSAYVIKPQFEPTKHEIVFVEDAEISKIWPANPVQ
jgi:hypothetical protein